MRTLTIFTVVLSAFVLNGCADVPEEGEEKGGTESDLTRGGSSRPNGRGANVGQSAGKGVGAAAGAAAGGNVGQSAGKGIGNGKAVGGNPAGGGGNAAPPASLPVLVTWNGVANSEASLDVVLNNGEVIGPCASVDVLRDEFNRGVSDGLGYLFNGTCVSPGITPNAGDIRTFRICTAVNNDWANARCTESAPWNHTTAPVHIDNN